MQGLAVPSLAVPSLAVPSLVQIPIFRSPLFLLSPDSILSRMPFVFIVDRPYADFLVINLFSITFVLTLFVMIAETAFWILAAEIVEKQ